MKIYIGQCQLNLNQAEAKTSFEQALAFTGDRKHCAEARYWLGQCYLKQGPDSEAPAQWVRVLSEYPDEQRTCALARLDMSKYYQKKGQKDQAIQIIGQLSNDSVVSTDTELLNTLAQRQLSLEDRTGAEATFTKLLNHAKKTMTPCEHAFESVKVAFFLHDYRRVVEETDAALKAFPNAQIVAEMDYYRAHALELTGDQEKALVVYEDIVKRYSARTDKLNRSYVASALMRAGVCLEKKGAREEAIAKYQQAINSYSDLPQTASSSARVQALQAEAQQQ